MKKIILLSVILCLAASVFAANITISYNGKNVVFSTKLTIQTSCRDAALEGFYDAYDAVASGKKLFEIYNIIAAKNFTSTAIATSSELKGAYFQAFNDFMTNYTAGNYGEFTDLYPIYSALFSGTVTYDKACEIAQLGPSRFFLRNL